jgi:hypothetical protein
VTETRATRQLTAHVSDHPFSSSAGHGAGKARLAPWWPSHFRVTACEGGRDNAFGNSCLRQRGTAAGTTLALRGFNSITPPVTVKIIADAQVEDSSMSICPLMSQAASRHRFRVAA